MKVAVVGGGVTGIAAALEAADRGADVLLFEAGDRLGGCLATHREGSFLFEDGPNSIPASDDAFRWLCTALGLDDAMIASRTDASVRRLHHDGGLRVVPTGPFAMLKSPLVGLRGLYALWREGRRPGRPRSDDETVDAFMRRRFGDRLTDTFLDAVIAGIWAGDPKRLGVASAFPELVAMEAEYGGVLRGLRARRARGKSRAEGLVTLRDGLGTIASAARARFGGSVRCGAHVASWTAHGRGWRLRVASPEGEIPCDADAIVCAVPSRSAVSLMTSLPGISVPPSPPTAGMAVVQLGYDADSAPSLPRGFGWLVPRRSGLRTLGCMVVSDIFDGRAPRGGVALGVFFGGTRDPEALIMDDDRLKTLALDELRMVVGGSATSVPRFARVVRWRDAVPQPPPGHADAVAAMRASLRRHAPRCAVAGAWVDGVAVGRCIESGRTAAREVLA